MRFPLVARRRRSTGNGVVRGGAGRALSVLSFELALLLAITRLLVGGRGLGLQKMTESKQMHPKDAIRYRATDRDPLAHSAHNGARARDGSCAVCLWLCTYICDDGCTRRRLVLELASLLRSEQHIHKPQRRRTRQIGTISGWRVVNTACSRLCATSTHPILFILSIHSGTSLPDCCTNLATE